MGSDSKKGRGRMGRLRYRITAPGPDQRRLDLTPVPKLWLADKTPKNLHTLFVGVNPGVRSAEIGHYFGGHTNYFWKLFHASGFWPTPLTTLDDNQVVKAGFGFTDTCKRPTPGTAGLTKGDFAESKSRIQRIVNETGPRVVVFVSKTALRAYLGKRTAQVSYGLQRFRIGDAEVYMVPSTSGASMADSSYKTKLRWFRQLLRLLTNRGIRWSPEEAP